MNHGDSKYQAKDGRIVKIKTGEPIPIDEPIFIFRARDKYAINALVAYLEHCDKAECTQYQLYGIKEMIDKFEKWQENNPTKEPGITKGI